MMQKIKIRAAVLEKINKKLNIKNIYHDSNLSYNQILVKIVYTGICGSQLGEVKGVKGRDKFLPHLLGHEATGIVQKTAKNIKGFKKNDKIILHWQKNPTKNSSTPKYFDDKLKTINAGWLTTFNTHAVVSKNRISKLPKQLSMKEGLLFGCSLTTAYGSVFKDSKINLKKKNLILITGGGMIGQAIIVLLYNQNQDIFIVENNPKKINFIRKNFPKIKFINDYKNNDILFDYIYETTGIGKIIELCYNSTKNNGKLILIGVPKFSEKININTLGINYGKKIIGSYGGGIIPERDIKKILAYIKKNRINLSKLIEGPYPFKKINIIINKMLKGQIVNKPIIEL
jgi:S-(hydroxymethyl)glutathione dehydrogenase/alcohol dehydrogenase